MSDFKRKTSLPLPSELVLTKKPSKNAVTVALRACITQALKSNDELLNDCLPYLEEGGITGSTQFDHHKVTEIVRENLMLRSNESCQVMLETIRDKPLWGHIAICIKQMGYNLNRGRVIGMLEYVQTVEDENPDKEPSSESES